MSEPTFTDEQLEDIREAIGWDDTRADVNNDNETITDILSAALAQGVVVLPPSPVSAPEVTDETREVEDARPWRGVEYTYDHPLRVAGDVALMEAIYDAREALNQGADFPSHIASSHHRGYAEKARDILTTTLLNTVTPFSQLEPSDEVNNDPKTTCPERHRHAPFVCLKCGYVGKPIREVSYGYAESFTRSDTRDFLNAAIAEGLVALPQAKVEDDAIVAAVDHIRDADCPHCEAAADLLERLAAERKPEGWRSRTVSDEERDTLAGAIARRCGVYPFEIQAETIKDFYRSDADAAIAALGLHRSAPKPQDEI